MKLPFSIPAGGTVLSWLAVVVAAVGNAYSSQIQGAVTAHPTLASVLVAIAVSAAAHGKSPTDPSAK